MTDTPTMRAFQLVAWQEPPELREVPVPEPGPGEVLIRVGGAGACHSDLHLMDWPQGQMPFEPPFTLGHENAGWVERVGAGVDAVGEGEAVAVYGPWGCGRCRACRRSSENYCERQAEIGVMGGGLGLDGGMAEYLLVPSARLLVPLGELDPRDAAPLSDAALTPYHAIQRSVHKLVAGSTAVVIGVGGLGQMAVQILSAVSGARIVAVDISPEKLALAAEVGADVTVAAGEGAAETIARGHLGAWRRARARHRRQRRHDGARHAVRALRVRRHDRRARRRHLAVLRLLAALRVLALDHLLGERDRADRGARARARRQDPCPRRAIPARAGRGGLRAPSPRRDRGSRRSLSARVGDAHALFRPS